MSVKKLSVVTIVVVILVTITTLLVISFAYMNFVSMKSQEENRLSTSLRYSAEELSSSLMLPVWNFDSPQIRRIIEIRMQEKNIYSIVVRAAEKIYAVKRDPDWNIIQSDGKIMDKDLLSTERTIIINNESLGTVIVYITPRFMNQYLRNALMIQSFAIVLLDLFLVLSLYLLLWKIVLKPLKKIEQYFVGINSESRTTRTLEKFRFYGELNNVMRSIEKMMSLLDAHYDEVQLTNELLKSEIGERLEKEEALLTSKSILRKIIDTIPQTVFWKDNDLKYLGCNSAFIKQAGLSNVDEIIGKTDYDLPWPIEETEAYRSDDREILQSRHAKMHIIEPLQQSDGKRLWIDTSKVPLVNSAGTVYGVLGVFEDITERKNANDKLRESEERYRTMFENAPVGIFYSTADGKILSVNNEYAEMLGYSSPEEVKEIVNRTSIAETIYVQSEDRSGVLEKTTAIPGSWIKSEKKFRKKDGTQITANVVIRSLQNNPNQLEGFIEDITDRKKAENELKGLKERFQTIFNLNPSAISISRLDTNIYVDVNNRFSEISGWSHEEIIGNCTDNFNLWVDPDAKQNAIDIVKEKGAIRNHEVLISRKNGDILSISLSSSIIELDGIPHLIVISEDVTERKKAIDELKEYKDRLLEMVEERTTELEQSRETFRALAENTTDVITRINEKFQFLYVNSAMKNVFGLLTNEYIGKTLDEFDFPKIMVERFENIISRVFETKQNQHAEFQLPIGIWADLLAMPEFDVSSHVCSVIISTRDITELKKLQNKLEIGLEKEKELNQLKNRFISMVSHEYRTPLTSILSSMEILEMGGKKYSDENRKKHFDRVQKNIDFMINMIDEVLYVNRIDSERVKPSFQSTNLEEFCLEIFDEIKELYPNIESTINILLNEKKYNVDVSILKKILGNLISNAYKYNSKYGRVDFVINSKMDKLIFKISDTGIGIPEEEQKNVFEPFIRMTNSQNIKGTGLGLSIVKKSVEQLGGSVTFQSKKDEGTTFTITLPITI